MTHKRNGPRNVPNTDAKPFGRDVLPVAWIHDCCLLGSVARRGTEESVFRNKTRKHTSKWRTTRTSSVYFPMIPIPYRFVPEVVGLHVPSCPSLNFISPTEALDPAWFWPDYCMHSKVTQWGIFLGKTPNTKERSSHYITLIIIHFLLINLLMFFSEVQTSRYLFRGAGLFGLITCNGCFVL